LEKEHQKIITFTADTDRRRSFIITFSINHVT